MLGRKGLLALMLLTAVAGAAAWAVRSGSESTGGALPERLFPELAARLNDVTALTIAGPGERFTLRRAGDEWGADEKDGHRVRFERLKPLLVGLSELRPLERKTSSPALHGKLGLQAPGAEGSQAVEVTAFGADGAPIAALIVGQAGPAARTRYVRKSGDDQAWLVQGEIAPEPALDSWIDSEITRLEGKRIASVTVTQPDGEVVTVSKQAQDDPTWTLQGLPEGREPKEAASANRLAESLQWLDFEDVAAASRKPLPDTDRAVTVFETWDGLRVSVTLAREAAPTDPEAEAAEVEGEAAEADAPDDSAAVPDAKNWIALSVGTTDAATEEVRAEAERLQARLGPWVYQVGTYLGSALRPRMDDLTQPQAEPPPAETEPEPAPEPDTATEAAEDSEAADATAAPPEDGG